MKKLATLFLIVIFSVIIIGCRKDKEVDESVLRIAFAETGYGRTWLENMIEGFKVENPNVRVILEGNPNMTANAGPRIESGRDLPDIFFLLDTNWQRWALRGLLEPLDDLYARQVSSELTLEEKLIDEIVEFGRINESFYALPWNDGVTGLVYNHSMFTERGWEVPKTFDELVDLTEQIKTEGAGIRPFTWPGQYSGYWHFVVYGWWAQMEGIAGMEEFFRFETPEVFLQPGRLAALEAFETLIGDQSNSVTGVNGLIHTQAQMQFLNGFAAMIPNGIWIEKEMENSLPANFEMRMMQIPALEGAVEPLINNTMAGDFIVIPKNASNKALAKDFLQYMSTEEALLQYTRDTGSPRPFKYDPTQIEGLSGFVQSALEIWKNSTNLYIISKNPMYFANLVNTFPKSGAPYGDIYLGEETAMSSFTGDYNYVLERWERFQRDAGLID
jgi:N-acetylglucosamine transport system substrate-binding protein